MSRLVLLMGLLWLAACDRGEPAATPQPAPAHVQPAANADPPQPTPGELRNAGYIVAFANHAKNELSNGYHAMPEVLGDFTSYYLANWRLPRRPVFTPRDSAAFLPRGGLFSEEDNAVLTQCARDMDRALDKLLVHYAALEKYILNPAIRDDGRQGKILARSILAERDAFRSARQKWLDIVNPKAQKAEAMLVAGHPLERQIRAARQILDQFQAVARILGAEHAQLKEIRPIAAKIDGLIQLGARPPFPGRPAVERVYRQFMKEAAQYRQALEELAGHGDHAHYRQNLNNAMIACQKSYNIFVNAAGEP